MRVFTVSDIHIDFEHNRNWLAGLSQVDYQGDILILAGDVADRDHLIRDCFEKLVSSFAKVCFVPGNHDLWVTRSRCRDSIEKFATIKGLAQEYGVVMNPVHLDDVSIVPLFGWYDFSFREPDEKLYFEWADFQACRWPAGFGEQQITDYFIDQNRPHLQVDNKMVISFSHFVPRADLIPDYIPEKYRHLTAVLGSNRIEKQVEQLNSDIHIYGHSHLNRQVRMGSRLYINNAFGYPYEKYAAKQLLCIYDP